MVKRRHVNTISSGRFLKSSTPDVELSNNSKIYTTKGGDEFILEKRRDETDGDTIVLKNGTEIINIPLSTIREKLKSLYEVRNVRISQLSAEHKEKFMNITTIMQGLRNTTSYNELISLIDEIFSKGTTVIVPGSINAYLNGCKVQTNFTPFACSPVCSGSTQPVDMGDGWAVCDKYTILFDEADSRFTVMNNPNDKEDAYIFVSSTDKFGGFTVNEKDALSSKGIKRVKIVSYDHTGKNTTNLNEDFVSLDNIKTKAEKKANNNNNNNDGGNNDWSGWYVIFWIILAIIVLLAVALIVYFIVMSSKKKKTRDTSDELFESMMSDSFGSEDNTPMIRNSSISSLARSPRSRIASSMTENL